MENDCTDQMAQSLQKTYENTLKFTKGQPVHIYVGGARYSFKGVVSLVVDTTHSLVTILTPNSTVLFSDWDGIEVGKGQQGGFVVSSEE